MRLCAINDCLRARLRQECRSSGGAADTGTGYTEWRLAPCRDPRRACASRSRPRSAEPASSGGTRASLSSASRRSHQISRWPCSVTHVFAWRGQDLAYG